MQFSCAACEKTYDISPRAFGVNNDTRTRCPNCKVWLIVTRSKDESTTTVIDPNVAASQESLANSISGKMPVADVRPKHTTGKTARPTHLPEFGLHPSAPTSVDPRAAPSHRHQSSGFVRPEKGFDMFALPDANDRQDRNRRQQMAQMLQDFSMMVRMDTAKAGRKRTAVMVLVLAVVGAAIYWAAQKKLAYDAHIDAAKEAKKLTANFVVQSAEGEFVPVPLAKGATATKAGPKEVLSSSLGRQLFDSAKPKAKPPQ